MANNNNYVMKTLASKFDQENDSNLVFVFEENKRIYAHRHYLALMSTHLCTMLSERWTDSQQREVTITDYDYSTFYAYIRFLYTGDISIDLDNLESLYGLSHCYLEAGLQVQCENFIMTQLNQPAMEKCMQLVNIYGSKEIPQRIQQWITNKLVNWENYTNLLALAHNYNMSSKMKEIEDFIYNKFSDSSLYHHVWTWHNIQTFKTMYIQILKYKLDKLETRLEKEFYNAYPSDYSKHIRKKCPYHYNYDCSCRIYEYNSDYNYRYSKENSDPQVQNQNWNLLKCYYEIALQYKSIKLQKCLETLLEEDFCNKPYETYQHVLNSNQDELLAHIENQLKTARHLKDNEQLIEKILKPAFQNGRFENNLELKDHLENALIENTKPEYLFQRNNMKISESFIGLLQIARTYRLVKLEIFLTSQLEDYLFQIIFKGEPTQDAVSVVQKILDKHKE